VTKTMSIRMDAENFKFLNEFSKSERSDLSKAVRDLVSRGRVFLAVENIRAATHPSARPRSSQDCASDK